MRAVECPGGRSGGRHPLRRRLCGARRHGRRLLPLPVRADSYSYPCDNVTAGTGCGLANDSVILDDGKVYATDTVKRRLIKIGEGTRC